MNDVGYNQEEEEQPFLRPAPAKLNRDVQLHKAAERRAKVIAFVNSMGGVAVSKDQIAENLGITPKEAFYTAKRLADNGLIRMKREGVANLYSTSNGHPAPAQPPKAPTSAAPTQSSPILAGQPKNGAQAAKEIELVVSGVVIVIGKNDKTGRIRITIEG